MESDLFEDLFESVREEGGGERALARRTRFDEPEHRDGARMEGKTTVYYAWAQGEGTYLFVPEDRVDDQLAIMEAHHEARTWGAFWKTLPRREAEQMRVDVVDQWKDAEDPAPEDPFPYDGDAVRDGRPLPGEEDGDWPPILNREITDWLPRDLLRDLEGQSSGPASGSFLTIGSEVDFDLVVATFAAHGYRLEPAPELVTRASGWWWNNARLTGSPPEE